MKGLCYTKKVTINNYMGVSMKRVTYHFHLYLSDNISYADIFKIKAKLKKTPASTDVFLITRALNKEDQLDIFHSRYLPQKFYDNHPLYVYGIAKTQGDALALVERITQECITKRGDANLIAYLMGE